MRDFRSRYEWIKMEQLSRKKQVGLVALGCYIQKKSILRKAYDYKNSHASYLSY